MSDFNPESVAYNVFYEHGLMMGRMISGSKSSYRSRYPDNLVIFNANIITINDKKIWHGDLDITIDRPQLKEIAKVLNQDLYILREMDARFGTEEDPIDVLLSKAATVISCKD